MRNARSSCRRWRPARCGRRSLCPSPTLAAKTPEGITCFLVQKDPGRSFGGISVSREIDKLGYKGIETVEMTYVGHRVPRSSVLGCDEGLGNGLHYILGSLELG